MVMTYRSTVWPVLLLASACAQAPVIQHDEPDYSAEQLVALAQSEDVQTNLEPFHQVPTSDAERYVTMSDGVRIAVSLYYPKGFDIDQTRAPTVYSETWYRRSVEARATAIALYQQAGYVVAIADPRGFAASFGSQPGGYLTEAQRNDQRELLAWIAEQPWSNGQVASIGISVSGMLAEAVLASGAPSLQAGIVRAAELDQYSQNVFPGGIANPRIHGLISEMLTIMRGEPCFQDTANCVIYGPVSEDQDFALVTAALHEHENNIAPDALNGVEFADDIVGDDDFSEVSPIGHLHELAEHAVPTRVTASWLDGATAAGALQRYNALPDVPMQLSLAATTHLAGLNADPFEREPFQKVQPSPEADYGNDIAFLTRVLAHEKIERKIDYYVLGANTWKSTKEWPPRDVEQLTLHFSQEGLEARSLHSSGEREYKVDPETSTGIYSRWASGTNAPIYFGDRRHAPGVRASFDAAPVPQAVELVGAPELCLAISSDQTDGAVFAYLEDVAPDGRVTYLTEGLLRLVHRKTQHQGGACDAASGTERSFKREDGAPVVPHELMHVEIPLLPVAARIAQGHHLRLSLAGADSDNFLPLTETPATWQIAYGGPSGSTLHVPVRAWD
jgi:putative CocE/NonD family hydrolase